VSPHVIREDGIDVSYTPGVFPDDLALKLLSNLLKEAAWSRPKFRIFDKEATTRRQVAWHADEGCHYAYSGQVHSSQPWTPSMQKIRTVVEGLLGLTFNGVLLNHYKDGTQSATSC